jgi:O-antigen/teichoic acid export membrane protein
MLTLPINAILISYLVRYKGGLTKKLWLTVIAAAGTFGILGFLGCFLVSPFVIKLLYGGLYSSAAPILAPAILGQVLYFVSGMLMMVLLRFKGEKKQLIFNAGYALEFFASVALATFIGELTGFVYGILIANAVRFSAVVIWGFIGNKNKAK